MSSKPIEGAANSWRSFIFPGILVLLGLGFALVPLARGEIFFYWDNAQQHYAQTDFLHRALLSGNIPHWWPNVGSGVPTVAEGQAAHFHPVRLLIALVFSPPIALMVEIGLYLAIAGVSTYFFLREFRLIRSACMVGGLCQMFGSFSVVFIRNMALHRSFCLLPLAMLLAERFVRRGKLSYGLAASLTFGLQLLSGHPTFAIVTIVATTVYILCRVLQRGWHVRAPFRSTTLNLGSATIQWGLVVILGFGIAAIQVIPTLMHIEHSIRQGGLSFQYAVASLPANIKYLAQLVFPYIYYQGDTFKEPAWWGGYFNAVPNMGIYLGTLPVLLAFLSLWWFKRWPDPAWPLIVCFLVALGFALGPKTPLFPALWSLPGMNGMRYPSRFLMWASFCFACLAGLGLHRLVACSRLSMPRIKKSLPFLLLAGGVLFLALIFWTQSSYLERAILVSREFHYGIIASLILFAVAIVLCCALLVLPRRYQNLLLAAAVLFVFVDLRIFRSSSGYAPSFPLQEVLAPPPVARFLRSDQDRFRVMSLISAEKGLNKNEDLFEFMQADTCTIWGIDSANAWMSLFLRRYYILNESILWELLNSPENNGKLAGFLGAMNVKYLVSPNAVTVTGWEKVFQSPRATTWKNPAFLHRTYLVGRILPEKIEVRDEWSHKSAYKRLSSYRSMVSNWDTRIEDSQIVDNILARPIDYRTTAVVAANDLPELTGLDPGSKVLKADEKPDIMTFEVQTLKPALLVISNNHYPGWRAAVNGKQARIFRTNYVGMGVLVPEGRSEVMLSYVTPGFRTGAIVTLASLGLCIGGFMVLRRFNVNGDKAH